MPTEKTPESPLAAAIAQIALELTVTKDRVDGGGYTYMAFSVDKVYDAVRPLLAAHGIAILPRPPHVTYVEHTKQGGGVQTTAQYSGQWMLIHAASGDEALIGFEASARDSGDKAPIQAGQQALKYALVQLFQIAAGDPEAEKVPEDAIDPAVEAENRERLENAARKVVWEFMAGEKVDGDQQKAEAEAAWPLVLEASGVKEIATEKDRDTVIAAAQKLYSDDDPEPGKQEKLEDADD